MFPGHSFPRIFSGEGGLDSHFKFFFSGHAALRDHVLVIVGHGNGNCFVGPDFFSADNEGDFDDLGGLFFEFFFEFSAFGATGQVAFEGVIFGAFDGKVRVSHREIPPFS